MTILKASLFENWYTKIPQQVEAASWGEYVDILLPPNLTHDTSKEDKRLTKAFSPVSYIEGATRSKACVGEVYALVVDYDELPSEHFAEVLTWLVDNNLQYATYSTFRHGYVTTRDVISARVIIPLATPVKAEDWVKAWVLLTNMLPHAGDSACKDASRIYGLPATNPLRLDKAFIEVEKKGVPLQLNVVDVTKELVRNRSQIIQLRVFNRDKELKEYVSTLRSKRTTVKGKWRLACFKALLEGEAFANEEQGRHETLRLLAADVAAMWPHVASDVLASEIFEPSLINMAKTQSGLDDIGVRLRDIERLIGGSRAYYEGNIPGVSSSYEQKFGLSTERTYDSTEPYTDAELRLIATEQGADEAIVNGNIEGVVKWLSHRWIVSNRGTYWILQCGGYSAGYAKSDVISIMYRRLAPAKFAGVELLNNKGKAKSIDVLATAYGTPANILRASLSATKSVLTVSPTGVATLVEKAGVVRSDLTPQYNEVVAGWLRALFGKQNLDKGLDWLACATKLTEPVAALYISGPSGIGKNMLTLGMARLFHDGAPCFMQSLLGGGNYNTQLTQCPIIVADEAMPKEATFENVCEMIGTTSRPLRRKFADEGTLLGATRVILTANKDSMMSFKQTYTRDQIEAVAKRVLHIEADDAAAKYLQAHPEHLNWAMGTGNEVTRHILWICQTREVERMEGARFLVEGNTTSMSRMLIARNPLFSKILQWLAKYIRNPQPVDRAYPKSNMHATNHPDRGVLMWCNPYVIQAAWSPYLDATRAPDIETISSALTALCPYGMFEDTAKGLWPVEVDHVALWATKNGFPTEGKISALIKRVKSGSTSIEAVN